MDGWFAGWRSERNGRTNMRRRRTVADDSADAKKMRTVPASEGQWRRASRALLQLQLQPMREGGRRFFGGGREPPKKTEEEEGAPPRAPPAGIRTNVSLPLLLLLLFNQGPGRPFLPPFFKVSLFWFFRMVTQVWKKGWLLLLLPSFVCSTRCTSEWVRRGFLALSGFWMSRNAAAAADAIRFNGNKKSISILTYAAGDVRPSLARGRHRMRDA